MIAERPKLQALVKGPYVLCRSNNCMYQDCLLMQGKMLVFSTIQNERFNYIFDMRNNYFFNIQNIVGKIFENF